MENQLSDQKRTEVKRKYRGILKRQWMICGLMVGLTLVWIAWYCGMIDNPVPGVKVEDSLYVYITSAILVLLFTSKSWKCPHCNRYFGTGLAKKFCEHCGVELK